MENTKITVDMQNALIQINKPKVMELVETAINDGLDLPMFITRAMTPAMEKIGEKFQMGEIFLPELQMVAETFTAAMDVLQSRILTLKGKVQPKGSVVIGTVKGDVHSIGKNLVATMLKTSGFKVIDLGTDVSTFDFLEEAEKAEADVIALSALLTTTMPMQQELIDALAEMGLREKYKVIIGGAPVNKKWAEQIGADEYGCNAIEAVKLIEKVCG